MHELQQFLDIARTGHAHLCPRIILGVRIGLAAVRILGLQPRPTGKRLLTIVECDGCFADGVGAATACAVGHRTLRVEDYGKVAATFVRTDTGQAVRVAPALDVRERAAAWVPAEPRHYLAQLRAYQVMPDDLLLTLVEVELAAPVRDLISRPGVRVACAGCGEEIINEREVVLGGRAFCCACVGDAYYRAPARATTTRLGRDRNAERMNSVEAALGVPDLGRQV